jgi:hypothetical protein
MGFLRRLFGGQPIEEDREVIGTMIVADRADAVLEVVGEQSYQENILAAAGGRDQNGPVKPDHVAALVLEPDNRYDKNAICVRIDGRRVGYLSREDDIRYGPVLRLLESRGKVLACEAHLKGGWYRGRGDAGSVGVSLHLGSPAETMLDLLDEGELSVRTDHPWPGQMVAFTGDSRCSIAGIALDREGSAMLARKAGLHVHPRVTKKVQLLVDCDPGGESGNQLKAIEYGIPVVSESEFWAALGVVVETIAWRPSSGRRS